MTTHRILTADSRSLTMLPDKSINCIVTSPPYPMIEMWDEIFSNQNNDIGEALKKNDGRTAFKKMHEVLNDIWRECDRVLKDNGFICINIGDATRTIDSEFQLFSNHTEVINFFSNNGYSVLPDIHWSKQSNSPNKFMGSGMYPAGAYVTYEHEYILIFRKGGKRVFKGEEKLKRQKSAFFWEERNVWFSDIWDVKGTSQKISQNEGTRSRNASFPFEIPYRLVNMYSAEGDTILDPFAGFGTTNLACMASGRNSIGIDIDSEIARLAMENIADRSKDMNDVIRDRISRHIDFIENLPQDKKDKCYTNEVHGFLVKTRQETAIGLDLIDEVKQTGDGFECTYKSAASNK